MKGSYSAFICACKNCPGTIYKINVLSAEIPDGIYDLLCKGSGDIKRHLRSSWSIGSGFPCCLARFLCRVHLLVCESILDVFFQLQKLVLVKIRDDAYKFITAVAHTYGSDRTLLADNRRDTANGNIITNPGTKYQRVKKEKGWLN